MSADLAPDAGREAQHRDLHEAGPVARLDRQTTGSPAVDPTLLLVEVQLQVPGEVVQLVDAVRLVPQDAVGGLVGLGRADVVTDEVLETPIEAPRHGGFEHVAQQAELVDGHTDPVAGGGVVALIQIDHGEVPLGPGGTAGVVSRLVGANGFLQVQFGRDEIALQPQTDAVEVAELGDGDDVAEELERECELVDGALEIALVEQRPPLIGEGCGDLAGAVLGCHVRVSLLVRKGITF